MSWSSIVSLISIVAVFLGPVVTYKWLGGKRTTSASVKNTEAEATQRMVSTASLLMTQLKEQLEASNVARAAAEAAQHKAEAEARSAWEAHRQAQELCAEDQYWRERVEPILPIEASWAEIVRDRLLAALRATGQTWPQDIRQTPPILAVIPGRPQSP